MIGLFVFLATIAFPKTSYGGIFSMFSGLFGGSQASANSAGSQPTGNSQNIALLKAATNINPDPNKSDNMPVIIDDSSILAEADPTVSANAPQVFDSSQINIYVVRKGDTLPQIADVFGVTTNTIMIANNMTSQKLSEGQRLIILPVSGIQHTVKKGETLSTIASAYKVKTKDILAFNHFESGSTLSVGDQIFVPSDTLPVRPAPARPSLKNINEPVLSSPLIGDFTSISNSNSTPTGFIEPLATYKKTQGLHGHNGIDLAAPKGTPIMAAADGEVIISRMGWNGGYGNYVVIQHGNNTQTLYAHASKLLVSEGDVVKQGQTIALVGSTGESTGPHLHVEVRGGKNPF